MDAKVTEYAPTTGTWSVPGRMDIVKDMLKRGCSARDIAAELGNGITKNAVLGAVHRAGLARPGKIVNTKTPQPSSGPKGRAGGLATAVMRARNVPLIPDGGATPPPPSKSDYACTFMELTEDSCRWPLGTPPDPNLRFCGAPKYGDYSYCLPHCRVAYQPRRPR